MEALKEHKSNAQETEQESKTKSCRGRQAELAAPETPQVEEDCEPSHEEEVEMDEGIVEEAISDREVSELKRKLDGADGDAGTASKETENLSAPVPKKKPETEKGAEVTTTKKKEKKLRPKKQDTGGDGDTVKKLKKKGNENQKEKGVGKKKERRFVPKKQETVEEKKPEEE